MFKWLNFARGALAAAVVGTTGVIAAPPVEAADKITFAYGAVTQDVQISELRTFVDTGEQSNSIRFIIKVAGLEPEATRIALNNEIKVSGLLLSKVFNSLPGEYLLFEASRIFFPYYGAGDAGIKTLRAAIVGETLRDGGISIIEFLEAYPTTELIVDVARVASIAGDVSRVIDRIGTRLEVPILIAKDLLDAVIDCGCEPPATAPTDP
ncbi:MAG: alpha/beta hydrolase [Cyanobacteria bacterium P01_H01_bin.15]